MASALLTIGIPDVLPNFLSLLVPRQRVRPRGTTQRQNNLDPNGLALGDRGSQRIAVLTFARVDAAGLAKGS